jgi:hypothetical protein
VTSHPNPAIGALLNRAWQPRRPRMRGVRTPFWLTAQATPHTAHPPLGGCGVACAVGGVGSPTDARSRAAPGERVVRVWRHVGSPSPSEDRTTLTHPSVTLSDENAPSRSRASPHPHPSANAAQRAAHGPPAAGFRSPRPLPSDREVS